MTTISDFFNTIDLTDSQIETVISAFCAWCQSQRVDIDSQCAEAAMAVAVNAIADQPTLTKDELLRMISLQISTSTI